MSETLKNYREMRGAWLGMIGGLFSFLFAIVIFILGPGFFSYYPNPFLTGFAQYWLDLELYFYYAPQCVGVASPGPVILGGFVMVFLVLIGGLFSICVGLFRRKVLGMSFSGFLLIVSSLLIFIGIGAFTSLYAVADGIIRQYVGIPEVYGFSINWIPLIISLVINLLSGFALIFGALQLLAARPIPVASYRRKRMQKLAKADTLERAGNPIKAIKFYDEAADISMKLKEEDKATEYYAKAREIHETAVEEMMKIEEERKRKELAARRAKLEEERKEILLKADEAEEEQDYMRAFHLYREAADRSVDLGQKKLAAQFTAKSKELRRRAKELEKAKKEEAAKEEKRKKDFERKKKEIEKRAGNM